MKDQSVSPLQILPVILNIQKNKILDRPFASLRLCVRFIFSQRRERAEIRFTRKIFTSI